MDILFHTCIVDTQKNLEQNLIFYEYVPAAYGNPNVDSFDNSDQASLFPASKHLQ